jgi:hypothetical protein
VNWKVRVRKLSCLMLMCCHGIFLEGLRKTTTSPVFQINEVLTLLWLLKSQVHVVTLSEMSPHLSYLLIQNHYLSLSHEIIAAEHLIIFCYIENEGFMMLKDLPLSIM